MSNFHHIYLYFFLTIYLKGGFCNPVSSFILIKLQPNFIYGKLFKGMVSQEQSMPHAGVWNSFVSFEHFIIFYNIRYMQGCEVT